MEKELYYQTLLRKKNELESKIHDLQIEKLEKMRIYNENIILEAISKQKYWNFENKRELIFHSDTGLLMPNFNYVRHIKVSEWESKKADFVLYDIGRGQWQCLHEINTLNFRKKIGIDYNIAWDYPMDCRGSESEGLCLYHFTYNDGSKAYFQNFHQLGDNNGSSHEGSLNMNYHIFPVYYILSNPDIYPKNPRSTTQEKARIILDFFLIKNWLPVFKGQNAKQANQIYRDLLADNQYKKQLAQLEQIIFEQFNLKPDSF